MTDTTTNGSGVLVTVMSVPITFPSSNVVDIRVVKVVGGGVDMKVVDSVVKCC